MANQQPPLSIWRQKRASAISDRQLAEWHRGGLIPTPKQQGLGRGKGSRSVYPNGTFRQAIACSALMHEFSSKEWVGWELWVRGYPVREEYWRNPIGQAHQTFELFFASVAEGSDEDNEEPLGLSEGSDELIAHLGDCLDAPERLGRARRRLGRERFKEFLGIAISTTIGSFEISEGEESERNDPVQVLARLIGVDSGKNKSAVPKSPVLEITGEAVAENLEAMAQLLPTILTSISPETISESELVSARDELIFLLNSFLWVRQNEARIVPGSTPERALLQQLFERTSPKQQATLLLIWLAVRNVPGWRENLDVLRLAIAKRSEGK